MDRGLIVNAKEKRKDSHYRRESSFGNEFFEHLD